jgi:hypothetical protein
MEARASNTVAAQARTLRHLSANQRPNRRLQPPDGIGVGRVLEVACFETDTNTKQQLLNTTFVQ